MLDAARGWASTRGLTIRPLRWSFASPPTAEELALEEPPMLPAPSFTAETDVGSIELQELGWSGEDGTLLHAPRLIYSVGRAPTHYEELRAHLASVPSWPGAPRLLSELDKWPQRQVESSDSLRFSAEHFFDRFWEAVGDRPLPPEVQDCADMLSRLLRENLGSDIFLPSSTKDYRREWVKVRNRGPFNTGRVTRIIRPGLCRSADSLIFPAVVDVE